MLSALLGLSLGACSTEAPGAGPHDESRPARRTVQTASQVAALRAAGDTRELTSALRHASVDQDDAVRSVATQQLARFEGDEVIPMLELALADRERGIRLDAARGLARHPAQPAALREAQILGALAAARQSDERAELIGLLADISAAAGSPAFLQSLASAEPAERASACLALQRLAVRGRAPLAVQLERAVELLGDEDAQVVLACASVLAEPVARETLPDELRAKALPALEGLLRSNDVEVARVAVQALAGVAAREAAPLLERLAGSNEPRIALESVRALRRFASAGVIAALADRELQRAIGQPGTADRQPGTAIGQPEMVGRGRVDVMLELFAGLLQRPDQVEASDFAERALRRLVPLPANALARARLERGLLQCAAARLADAARHWPKELFECGHGAVPEGLRDVWIAEAFAGVEDSDELRALQLGRLFAKGPAALRVAVLRGTATLPVKLAAEQLKLGLSDRDPRVLAAAALATAARPALRDAEAGSRIEVADLLHATVDLTSAPEAAVAWLEAARVLGRGPQPPIKSTAGSTEHEPGAAAHEPEPIAIKPLSAAPAALIERVTQLARHSARAIRDPARALLSEWEAPVPADTNPVAEPFPADRLPAPGTLFHVKLQTTAGTIELALDSEHAPISAVRFLERARSGALDGLVVADRSAGHAVAFSPAPSADRPALRHEDTYAAVERGSVLLQDHGRDAVGPGFALILARAPSLDRRAVRIGTITRGLEVADSLTAADSILEAQVETRP